jgi:endoglucanase
MIRFIQICITVILIMNASYGYYTTKGTNIIDRKSGEKVILRGFGLGCWLLPEGYMWGIRNIDRPRQFEKAIETLIGKEDAAEFWRLYHENFLIEEEIKAMKSWGVNSVRVALLASQLQPRENQPDYPPYHYSEEGFRFLDSLVTWCKKYKVGVIWDMHGAPGAQNAENIADSDGEARLWTEKEKYWPMCNELWYKIAERYQGNECIIGYDLLNEPLLRRYDNISTDLLRELYVQLTHTIRSVDTEGIIFIEGDDWAQNFEILEPMDWDPHLVMAFHSYPPTADQRGLQRWDNFRNKYNIPLWHGETGEQRPPYNRNRMSTAFLESANVGWSWWTHKKFDRNSQPWNCLRTPGFLKILDYWQGRDDKPDRQHAKTWLFDQASKTHARYCIFLPDMVRSLVPLNPDRYLAEKDTLAPEIVEQPPDSLIIEEGGVGYASVRAMGFPLHYQWYKNGSALVDHTSASLRIDQVLPSDHNSIYSVKISNSKATIESGKTLLIVTSFSGPVIHKTSLKPVIDGAADALWEQIEAIPINMVAMGRIQSSTDLSGSMKLSWDQTSLYLLVHVIDDTLNVQHRNAYERDGIEIYLDINNDKADNYGKDDFHLRYSWHDADIDAAQGDPGSGILAEQSDVPEGYLMEIAFPWTALSASPTAGQFIGIDIHINDNDGHGRDGKLSWHSRRNAAYRSPRFLGTMRLSE